MNIFTVGKYEAKVKSIITVSKIYSIEEISEIADISEDDTIKLIERMIKKSRNDFSYRVFKNAHVNYQTYEVILDESKSASLTDQVSSFINKLRPQPKSKSENLDWKCSYCGSINKERTYECSKCNASKG